MNVIALSSLVGVNSAISKTSELHNEGGEANTVWALKSCKNRLGTCIPVQSVKLCSW